MRILKLCIYLTLLGCGNVDKGHIVVTGRAEDAKPGATVVSNDRKQIHYVHGLDFRN
jgi:hypothetical protein